MYTRQLSVIQLTEGRKREKKNKLFTLKEKVAPAGNQAREVTANCLLEGVRGYIPTTRTPPGATRPISLPPKNTSHNNRECVPRSSSAPAGKRTPPAHRPATPPTRKTPRTPSGTPCPRPRPTRTPGGRSAPRSQTAEQRVSDRKQLCHGERGRRGGQGPGEDGGGGGSPSPPFRFLHPRDRAEDNITLSPPTPFPSRARLSLGGGGGGAHDISPPSYILQRCEFIRWVFFNDGTPGKGAGSCHSRCFSVG